MEQTQKELEEAKAEVKKLRENVSVLEEQLAKSKNEQKVREDEMFWNLVNQVNMLKKALQESENKIKGLEEQAAKMQAEHAEKLKEELAAKDGLMQSEREKMEESWK